MRLSESHACPSRSRQAWTAERPRLLRRALPGCESLVEIAPDEFVAEMAVPLGLATAPFTVYVHRRDVDAPRPCTLHFETRTDARAAPAAPCSTLSPTARRRPRCRPTSRRDGRHHGRAGRAAIELAAHEMAGQFFEGLRALAAAAGRVA